MFGRTYESRPIPAVVVGLSSDEESHLNTALFVTLHIATHSTEEIFNVKCKVEEQICEFEIDEDDYTNLAVGDTITVYRNKAWNRKGRLIKDYYDFYQAY
jgi:hypothetical protein